MASWHTEFFGESILTKDGLKPTAEALNDKKCKCKDHKYMHICQQLISTIVFICHQTLGFTSPPIGAHPAGKL